MAKQVSIYPRHFLSDPPPRQATGFILMPFGRPFDAVCKAIRKGIRDAALKPLRADDDFLTRASLEKILRGIAVAQVVVADMTGRNPNVFYEVGIAHAAKENVILLAQSIRDDLPFDLRHIDHLEYELSAEGLRQLSDRLCCIIRTLPPEPQAAQPQASKGGLRIEDGVEEHEFFHWRDSSDLALDLHLSVTNESGRSLTLVEPSIEFNRRGFRPEFRSLRVDTGGGRKSVAMSKGRTAIVSAIFNVKTETTLKKGYRLTGTLIVRVAQPDFGEYRYPFRVVYSASR